MSNPSLPKRFYALMAVGVCLMISVILNAARVIPEEIMLILLLSFLFLIAYNLYPALVFKFPDDDDA